MADVMNSSDDEAPEEISFSSSKKQKLSQEETIRQASKLKKQKEKEKRSKQNDLFRLQKQKKLSDLSSRKLPQEILNAASGPVEADAQKGGVKVFTSDNEDGDVGGEEMEEDRLSDSGLEDGEEEDTEDFISLSTTPKWMKEVAAKEQTKKKPEKTKRDKEKEKELELKSSFMGLGNQYAVVTKSQDIDNGKMKQKKKKKRKSLASGPVNVMTRDQVLDVNLSSMQKAQDFRDQMLYRNRERVSNAERSAMKERKRLRDSLKKGMIM